MVRAAPLALLVLFFLAAGACGTARPRASPPAAPAIPSRHVLPNGVRVIVQEHRASHVVAVQLWVRAGGRDEAPSELGLAHYLEHMLFKGTATRPLGSIDRAVEGVGGRINAATSLDYTYYHMVVPSRWAASGIEVLADIAVNATLDGAALEREKLVVLEEMRRGEDNPRVALLRQLYALVFDSHPYARPVIGDADLVRALTRDTLLGFYRRHYTPGAFTLVLVGAVSPADVVDTATRAFAPLPRTGEDRLPLPLPPPLAPRHTQLRRPGGHAYLAMGWPAPRLDAADTPAVDLLVSILGETRSSRLTQALRDRHGLVNSVRSSYSALEAAGLVTVFTQLHAANLTRAEEAIVAEVRRLRAEGVSEAERRRAVTREEARLEFANETAEGRAHRLGAAETLWRLDAELAYVDRLRAVTREQIAVAARRYLDPERYARVTSLP
ncbi:MAG: M16 family metallopeptidase [Candidatus Rokuibacteriota bacterium]